MITRVKEGIGPSINSPFFCFGLGSCFVSNLAPYFKYWQIPYGYNPLGTSFNPISIAQQLDLILSSPSQLPEYYKHQESYHALFAANKFQHTDHAVLSENIDKQLVNSKNLLSNTKNSKLIIISFGTAHAWYMKEDLVNNCHKLPGQLFNRKILPINEIVKEWNKLLEKIPSDYQFIFTVSPVKYTKIGLQENFKSKSILRLAIEELITTHQNCTYFPSYEIITDELRDYSFWNEHGTHPNDKAVAEVMSRFKNFLSL